MSVENSTCAPSGEPLNFSQIDWQKCERFVNRLQARIVKSTQAGRWGKVKALQRLLTHSFYGRALAVRRVTENKGKRTPGVDGAIWSTPASKSKAIHSLRRRGYPTPHLSLFSSWAPCNYRWHLFLVVVTSGRLNE
jgi:RNA-directed DNA polymerase